MKNVITRALFKLYNLKGPLINIDWGFNKLIDLKEFLRPITLKNTFQQVPKLYDLTMELNHVAFQKDHKTRFLPFAPL
jgi:hypothetical protein